MGLFRDSWKTVAPPIRPLLLLVPVGMLIIGYWLPPQGQILLIIGLLLAILVMLYLVFDHRHRQAESMAIREYHQVEALLGLYRQLDPPFAFQGLRQYAASPDMLLAVLDIISRYQPKVIVELGSGSSTKMIDAYLAQTGSTAEFYSIEHDHHYLEETRKQLSSGRSRLIHCPLKEYKLEGKAYSWYDLSALQLDQPIDLLIVDGPPEQLNDQARYPAFPLFKEQLDSQAIIILDDTDRPDEQLIISRWMKEDRFSREGRRAEKGLTVLFRQEKVSA